MGKKKMAARRTKSTQRDKKRKPESDDDFERPSATLKKMKIFKEKLLKKSEKFIHYKDMKMRCRVSPMDFINSIKSFSDAQKEDVKSMGFGSILTMDITSIPTALGYWLLVNYNADTNKLNMGKHTLKVTPAHVFEVFGIPNGKIQVLEKTKPRKGANAAIDEFRNQFDKSRISVTMIIPLFETQRAGGKLFKLNFIVCWNTIFGEITKSTTVNLKCLMAIEDEQEISTMDWCSYMVNCLKRTKQSWKGIQEQYTGPIALLAILYTHEHNKRHHRLEPITTPAITYITSRELNDMEEYLYNNGPLTDNEDEEQSDNDDDDDDDDDAEKDDGDKNTGDKGNDGAADDDENATKKDNDGGDGEADDDEDAAKKDNDGGDGEADDDEDAAKKGHDGDDDGDDHDVQEGDNNDANDGDDVQNNDDDDYRLPPVHTPHAIIVNLQDVNMETNSDGEQHYHNSPIINEDDIGTDTQRMLNDFHTPTGGTGASAYIDTEQVEASKKAKEKWIKRMKKNIKTHKQIVQEMKEMVDVAKEKYFWDDDIMKQCAEWEAEVASLSKQEGKTVDVNDNVVNLGDQTQKNVTQDTTQMDFIIEKIISHLQTKPDGGYEYISTVQDSIQADHVHDDNQDESKTVDEVDDAKNANKDGGGGESKDDGQDDGEGEGGKDKEHGDDDEHGDEDDDEPIMDDAVIMNNIPLFILEDESKKKIDDSDPETPKNKKLETMADPTTSAKITRMEKRNIKLALALKSPYVNRIVSLGPCLTTEELIVTQFMFAPIKDKFLMVYHSTYGMQLMKVIFESCYPGITIETNIIDAWAEILNIEEKKRRPGSPYRLFAPPTTLMRSNFEKNVTDKDRAILVQEVMDLVVNKYDIILDEVDMIIIPIIQSEHFYVISFNIRNGTAELLDNSSNNQQKFNQRYNLWPQKMQKALHHCLKNRCKNTVGIDALGSAQIERIEMPWRTSTNTIDCGIFAMRHMETYKGNKQWRCGLAIESELQTRQLTELRLKYIAKIILSDHNLLKKEILEKAKKFDEFPNKNKALKGLHKKISKRL